MLFVRRMLTVFTAAVISIAMTGCGGSKSTAPAPDPNQAMYGTWTGNLVQTVSTVGGPVQTPFTCQVVLAKGSVAFYVDGIQYPAALVAMQDPNLAFQATNGSYVITYSAARAGSTINGAGNWPNGITSDIFALTKSSPSMLPIKTRSTRPDPRFGPH